MIRLDQPRNNDLVDDPILIGGVGTGFEATFAYRVSEGHDEIVGHIMAGGGTGEHAQFQKKIYVKDAAFKLPRLFLDVFEFSAKDGSEINKTSRIVFFGPLIIEGYYGYREHKVVEGETLSSIARYHYGTSNYNPIYQANNISDINLLVPGKTLKIPIGS